MSPVQTLVVFIRLGVLRLLVEVGDDVLQRFWAYFNQKGFLVDSAIFLVVTIYVSLRLYKLAPALSVVLLRGTQSNRAESAQPEMWFVVGCRLLGLWFLLDNLPRLATNAILYVNGANETQGLSLLISETFTSICGMILLMVWPRMKEVSLPRDRA